MGAAAKKIAYLGDPLMSSDTIQFATVADVWAGASGKVITPEIQALADAFQSLTYAATLGWNPSTQGYNVIVTRTGSITLATPVGMRNGQYYVLGVNSGAGGSHTFTPPANIFEWTGGITPTLSTAANKLDVLRLQCVDATTSACKATWVKAP